MLNAVMSVLDGFENTKRVVEEKLCEKLVFEGIEIDISRRLIYRGKSEIKTTFVEFEILHLLARNPGKVFSKEQIYDIVWKEPYFGDCNIVMSHIRNLREKIEDKAYVAEHNGGMQVSNLYIAQVKAKYGIKERANYNLPKLEDVKQPHCPKEKEDAIVEALRFFHMI